MKPIDGSKIELQNIFEFDNKQITYWQYIDSGIGLLKKFITYPETEIPDCLALPATQAPERQIILDVKEKDWNNLDERFGIGAGSLFKYLDDAILLPDHHCWTEYIGNRVKKSKDAVWSIMIEEWCKQCAESENISHFLEKVRLRLRSAENIH